MTDSRRRRYNTLYVKFRRNGMSQMDARKAALDDVGVAPRVERVRCPHCGAFYKART
jgi:hypothetical protein